MVNTAALPHLFQEELYRFQTSLVVVLAKPWTAYTPDEQALLKKILGSVRIDINAIAVVTRPVARLDDLGVSGPARVLVFGSELPADVPMYQCTTAQAFSVIRADDLAALDDQKKKNLWVALRQMFGI